MLKDSATSFLFIQEKVTATTCFFFDLSLISSLTTLSKMPLDLGQALLHSWTLPDVSPPRMSQWLFLPYKIKPKFRP
jgi:hypothetical protein